MDILRFFSENILKLILGAIFFIVYYYLYALIRNDYFIFGYRESDYIVSFSIVTVAFVFLVKFALSLIGAQKLNERFMTAVKWAFYAVVIVSTVYFVFSKYSVLKGSSSHLATVLKAGAYCFAGYVAYLFGVGLLCFLGKVFGILGDGLPSGRPVLFGELLNNGYSKPQIRVFIADLNVLNGGAVYVYTTLVLYVIPVLAILLAPWSK